MKYIKTYSIFEAIESAILSKTLGFIQGKQDRDKFLNLIKNLCIQIDYPLSKLRDEFFEYLSFKKALAKADKTGDEPCEATSEEEFPEYSVEGSKCEGGKLKRKWGARVREVVCPRCHGTGLKEKKSELKLLKFWFNKDGKFITATAVDGLIRSKSSIQKFSQDTNDYKVVKPLTHSEAISTLQTGDFIKVNIEGKVIICKIWRDNEGRVFAIQNYFDGTSPWKSTAWKEFGRFSWEIQEGEYHDLYLVEPIDNQLVEEADPYEWNVGLSYRYGFKIDSSINIESEIEDAHFAIVLDFGKLKKSDFTSKSDIVEKREKIKQGSKLDPDQSDEEIKKRNIERYMDQLSKSMDISSDIRNCSKIISRLIGYKNALYIILYQDVTGEINNLISKYLDFMKSSESELEYRLRNLQDKANVLIRRGMNTSRDLTLKLEEVKKSIKEPKVMEVFNEIESLSQSIYQKINSYQIDSLEDLEVLNQKIESIRNIFRSSRYQTGRIYNYYISSLYRNYSNSAISYINDDYYIDPELCLMDLKTIRRIIDKI